MFLPCLLVRLLTTTPGIIASAIVTLTIGAANECVSEDGSAVSERSSRFTCNVTIKGLSVDEFVYPHVEVNGEAWPRDRVETEFTSNSE